MTPNILVVDDDSICQEAVQRHLGNGYTVTFSDTMARAHLAITTNDVDCVLLDFRLPDGSGLELLPSLADRGIPVIVFTSQGNEEIAVRAMHGGADDYLVKNALSPAMLHRAIGNAMERARLRNEIHLRELEKDELIEKLQVALRDIETLRGLISICARCKKVRDDDGAWHPIETYVSRRSQARFTHGFCPECFEREVRAVEDE